MKAFGIELRKTGRESIYEDVDMVLNRAGINDRSVSKSVQSMALAHSLTKMLKVDRYFDVCTVKNGADMCQICIPKERMQIYQSIHCMHWNEMEPDFRTTITAMILDDFRLILMA